MTDLIDRPEAAKPSIKKYDENHFITDKIRWYIYGLFLIGFIFKFMHWPFGGVFTVLSGGFALLLIIGVNIEGFKRKNKSKAFFDVMTNFVLIYFVFRLQYWQWAMGVLGLVVLSFTIGFAFYRLKNKGYNRKMKTAIALLFVSFGLHQTPQSSLFYYTGLTETFHSYAHNNAHQAWDRYAWHLNAEGKTEEALFANSKAMNIAQRDGDTEYVELMKEHRAFIERR